MDGWNAPQWADFDASVKSDIDEYFNVEHEELESGLIGDLQYHSCPSTPNSKKGVSESPYKTPEMGSFRESHRPTSHVKNLQTNEEKKLLKGKLSITPRSYMLRKACSRPSGSSTPQVIEDGSVTTNKIMKDVKEQTYVTENNVEGSQGTLTAVEVVKNLDTTDSDDDDNVEQNCTLLAAVENENVFSDQTEHCDLGTVAEQTQSATNGKTIQPAVTAVVDEEAKISCVEDRTEISEASSSQHRYNNTDDQTSKPQSCAKASTHINPKGKKNSSCRPVVLTSKARRQSTSKYRRVSNKYVSLAEAVSKFQNGTPERFRSTHKKDPKTSGTAGPVQKVKHAVMKLTCAKSPILRCKYRSRVIPMSNEEERKISEMEEIRKNRLNANTIKRSLPNSQGQLKNTATLPKTMSKAKKTLIDEPSKEIDTKVTSQQKSTRDPSKLMKEVGESTTLNRNAARRCKTMMGAPKPQPQEMKKSVSGVDSLSISRRTMMNPQKALEKMDKSAMNTGTLTLSRRTMVDSSKSKLKIDNKPTTIADAFSRTCKTPMNPPGPLKRIDVKPKPTVDSVSLVDKSKDANILSTSMMTESVKKHTPCKKTVPTVVSTEEGVSIKDVEILHFGIPVGTNYKKMTEPVPFRFESHNKNLQSRKEKLKSRPIEEEKKPKPFQARPVPSYVTKSSSKLTNKPLAAIDAPFSFQRRNEITLKKKKELFDQVVEREKQARIFHAKPAPKFKPVFVRGASSENLRSNNVIEKDKKTSQGTRQRGLSQGLIIDNCENTAPNVPTTNQPKLKDSLMDLKLKKTS